jgi:hypothetical protein
MQDRRVDSSAPSSSAGSQPTSISVRALRFDLRLIRWAQVLIPLATLSTVTWRHWHSTACLAAAISLLATAMLMLLRGIRRMGRHLVRIRKGRLVLLRLDNSKSASFTPAQVHLFTVDRHTAKLYLGQTTWKLVAGPLDAADLHSVLRQVLGRPLTLQRRGSFRLRMIALGSCGVGIVVVAAAAFFDLPNLVFLGVPLAILGLATFATYTQKVIREPLPPLRR